MAPVVQSQSQSQPPAKRNLRTLRRNRLRKRRGPADAVNLRLRLNKQLNRIYKYVSMEKDFVKRLHDALVPSDVSGVQTDLEDVRRKLRLVQSEVTQIQGQQDLPILEYIHTPIGDVTATSLPKVPVLDSDEETTVRDALCYPEWKHRVLTKEDLDCLKQYYPNTFPTEEYWLNDAVMAEYLRLLTLDSPDAYSVDSSYCRDIVAGSKKVVTVPGLKKKKLFSYKKLVFPSCKNNHWTLATWDASTKTMTYYDSLNTPTKDVLQPYKLFLNQRQIHEGHSHDALCDLKEVTDAFPRALKQTNAVDCGIYVLMAARAFIQGFPFTFDNSYMNLLRKCILYELVSDHLLPMV